MEKQRWTNEELAQLRELAKTHRDEEIAQLMGKKLSSVSRTRNRLGIKLAQSKRKTWTEADIERLRELAQTHSDQEIAKIMGSGAQYVQVMRLRHGIISPKANKRWTEEEVSQLKELSLRKENPEISEVVERSRLAVTNKKREQGFNKFVVGAWSEAEYLEFLDAQPKGSEVQLVKGRWSEPELERFRELAKDHRDEEIAKLLNRKVDSIRTKRADLGLKIAKPKLMKWSEEELAQFQSLVLKKTDEELAEILGRSVGAVKALRINFGLSKALLAEMTEEELAAHFERRKNNQVEAPIMGRWSEDERVQLRELVNDGRGDEEIARLMNRTVESIRGQRSTQGLGVGDSQVVAWTDLDVALLKDLVAQGKTNQEIGRFMKRTARAIQQEKLKLGLNKVSLRKWSEQEVLDLRALAQENTIGEIAKVLERDWSSVAMKCKELAIQTLSVPHEMRPFTREDDEVILKFSRYLTNEQLAEKLDRTKGAVMQRKHRLRKKGYDIGTGREMMRRKDWLVDHRFP